MVKIGYSALAIVAVLFIASLIPGSPSVEADGGKIADGIGKYIAGEETAQTDAAFQRQLQSAIDAGQIIKAERPDGTVEYRNSAL